MGGNNSIIDNINNAIADNILNSIQEVQKTSKLTQSITGKCDSDTIKILTDGYNNCIFTLIDIGPAAGDLSEACSPFADLCSMTDISLSSSINIADSSISDANVEQQINTNINNYLQQYNKGGSTDQLIKNINNQSVKNISNILEQLKNSSRVTQTIELNNFSAKFISLKNSITVITNVLQSDNELQKSISDVSNIITQTSDNSDNSYLMNLYIIIGIALVISVILKVTMMMSNSKDYKDFFKKFIPYIGFIIISAIVVGIHLIFKPSYITYTNIDGKKYIDNKKFGIFMSVYIGIIFLIFYITNGIINK
jgi:hypothetical protein